MKPRHSRLTSPPLRQGCAFGRAAAVPERSLHAPCSPHTSCSKCLIARRIRWLGFLFKEPYARWPFCTMRLTTTTPYRMPEHFRSRNPFLWVPRSKDPNWNFLIIQKGLQSSSGISFSGFHFVDPLRDLGNNLVFCSTIGRNLQLVQASFPSKTPSALSGGPRFLAQVPKQGSPFP